MRKPFYERKLKSPLDYVSVISVNINVRDKFGLSNLQSLILDAMWQLREIKYSNNELCKVLGVERLSLYTNLKELREKNLIDDDSKFTSRFIDEALPLILYPVPKTAKKVDNTSITEIPFKSLLKKMPEILKEIGAH